MTVNMLFQTLLCLGHGSKFYCLYVIKKVCFLKYYESLILSLICFLPKKEIHEESSSHFRPKKPKPTPSEDRRFNRSTPSPPPRPPTSTTTTGYIQGMSLIINNSSDSSQHDLSGRISTSGVTESREIPGAIAIPIQVC